MQRFHYHWRLSDASFTKDKGKVFSCFAGGGGSTMGYKLAGFDVLGCNEIDPKMMRVYIENHSPKYSYLEPIQTFKDRLDLPEELYDLDILDGSPPCSSFSVQGLREKTWGKEKMFREGQAPQVLDELFFEFIALGRKLQPKIIVAENVKGLLIGAAKSYVSRICNAFDDAGYTCQYWLLDASKMGVPQRRERVFFIAIRKDLANTCSIPINLFDNKPYLDLAFNNKPILFEDIIDENGIGLYKPARHREKLLHFCKNGESVGKYSDKKNSFGAYRINPKSVLRTITAGDRKGGSGPFLYLENKGFRSLTEIELKRASTFPQDYKAKDIFYVCGMSVPPVMMANIASRIYELILSLKPPTSPISAAAQNKPT